MKHPPHIIRKSKKWFYDTVRDTYIPALFLSGYLEGKSKEATGEKDADIRRKRFDLNYD